MAEKKEKTYAKLDEKDWSEKITLIVDELHRQANSREVVTQLVNNLNNTYGIKKPVVRAVASVIFKRNQRELEEQSSEILELARMCK